MLVVEDRLSDTNEEQDRLYEQASLIKIQDSEIEEIATLPRLCFVVQEAGLYFANSPLGWIWNWMAGQVRPFTVQLM